MTLAAGIDVGGTKCLGVLIDDDGRVVRQLKVGTPQEPVALIEAIAAVARELGDAASLGVGLPGLVTTAGVVRSSPNLPMIKELDARAELEATLGHAVVVGNDASCAALAEWRLGAGRGVDELVLVTLGTGIGGGLVQGGRLQVGANGFAGEIGHMTVQRHGIACPCGRRGCWERYASGSGLATLSGGRRGEELVSAALAGDVDALAVIEEFADWVAIGLVNLTNLLDPARIVLGGGLAEAAAVIAEPIQRRFAARLYAPEHRPHPGLVFASLGEEAGAIGAALLGAGRT
jgi:glucokinase